MPTVSASVLTRFKRANVDNLRIRNKYSPYVYYTPPELSAITPRLYIAWNRKAPPAEVIPSGSILSAGGPASTTPSLILNGGGPADTFSTIVSGGVP